MAGVDTIHIRLPLKLDELELSKLRTHINGEYYVNHNKGFEIRSVNRRNIKVSLTGSSLIIKGSLSKYFNGPINEGLGWGETIKAINELSSVYGVDLDKGEISRIDIAGDLGLRFKVRDYFAGIKRMIKNQLFSDHGSMILLRNSGKQKLLAVAFYDKIEEILQREKVYPLVNRSVMRYELRMHRKYLMDSELPLCVGDLKNRANFNKLISIWKDRFVENNKVVSLMEPLKIKEYTPKSWLLNETLLFIVSSSLGQDYADYLDSRYETLTLPDSSNSSRQKKKIGEEISNAKAKVMEDGNDLLAELLAQVKEGGLELRSLY